MHCWPECAGVTVKGGAGNDVLKAAGSGTVVLSGGEGRDVFDLSGFKSAGSAATADIIVKLTGLRDLGSALLDPTGTGSLVLA